MHAVLQGIFICTLCPSTFESADRVRLMRTCLIDMQAAAI